MLCLDMCEIGTSVIEKKQFLRYVSTTNIKYIDRNSNEFKLCDSHDGHIAHKIDTIWQVSN